MRFLNKYKLHEHFASASRKLPLRINKFKRTKWTVIKRKFWVRKWVWNLARTRKKKYKGAGKFTNFFKVHVSKQKYYLRNSFKIKLQTKKYILSLYDNSIKIRLNHKIKYKRDLLCFHFTRSLFRIDILLWYLKVFTSSVEARLFLNSKNVFVNNKPVKSNYYIKKGDVISLESFSELIEKRNSYRNIKAKYKKSRNFFPFLEFDYYTNTFVVLKDWQELSYNDLTLIITENKKIRSMLYK